MMTSLLGGIIGNAIGDAFTWLWETILKAIYMVWLAGAWIVNLIEDLFRMLVGLKPIASNAGAAADTDITTMIINNRSIQQIFANLTIFATILLIFFTILQIVREHYKDKNGGNPYVLVFRMVKAMTLFMFVTAACVVGLQLSKVVLTALDRATGHTSGGIAGTIFVSMATSGNRVAQPLDADNSVSVGAIDDVTLYGALVTETREPGWIWIEPLDIILVDGGKNPNNDDDVNFVNGELRGVHGVDTKTEGKVFWIFKTSGKEFVSFWYMVEFDVSSFLSSKNAGEVDDDGKPIGEQSWDDTDWDSHKAERDDIWVGTNKSNYKKINRNSHTAFASTKGNPYLGTATATGAVAGAVIGSVIPGVGTILGGVVGAVGGFIVGLVYSEKTTFTDMSAYAQVEPGGEDALRQFAYSYVIGLGMKANGKPVSSLVSKYGTLNKSYFYLDGQPTGTMRTYFNSANVGGYAKTDSGYANWVDDLMKEKSSTSDKKLKYYKKSSFLFWDTSSTKSLGKISYQNLSAVSYLYDIKSFNWIIGFGGLFIALGVYNSFAFAMIQRIAELGVLYMFSPVTLAFFPFDDGAQFNNAFVKPFYKKVISAYAPVVSLNLFFVILEPFNTLHWFDSRILDTLASAIVSIALLSMLPKVRSSIQAMLGADQMDEKKMFGKGGIMENARKQIGSTLTAPKRQAQALQKFGSNMAFKARDRMAYKQKKRDAIAKKAIESGSVKRLEGETDDAYAARVTKMAHSRGPVGSAMRTKLRAQTKVAQAKKVNADLRKDMAKEGGAKTRVGQAFRNARAKRNIDAAMDNALNKGTDEEKLKAINGNRVLRQRALTDYFKSLGNSDKDAEDLAKKALASKNGGTINAAMLKTTREGALLKDKDGKPKLDENGKEMRGPKGLQTRAEKLVAKWEKENFDKHGDKAREHFLNKNQEKLKEKTQKAIEAEENEGFKNARDDLRQRLLGAKQGDMGDARRIVDEWAEEHGMGAKNSEYRRLLINNATHGGLSSADDKLLMRKMKERVNSDENKSKIEREAKDGLIKESGKTDRQLLDDWHSSLSADEKDKVKLRDTRNSKDNIALQTAVRAESLSAKQTKLNDARFDELVKDKMIGKMVTEKSHPDFFNKQEDGTFKLKEGDDLKKAYDAALNNPETGHYAHALFQPKQAFAEGVLGTVKKVAGGAGKVAKTVTNPWKLTDAFQGAMKKLGDRPTVFGSIMDTIFDPDNGLFYQTEFGKMVDGFSYHKTFKSMDNWEKGKSERTQTEAFARARTYRFAGAFAENSQELTKLLETEKDNKAAFANLTSVEVGKKMDEEKKRAEDSNKAIAEGFQKVDPNGIGKAITEALASALKANNGDVNSLAYKNREKEIYSVLNNGNAAQFKEVFGKESGTSLYEARNEALKNKEVKNDVEKHRQTITKYEENEAMMKKADGSYRTHAEFVQSNEGRKKQLNEYMDQGMRILGISAEDRDHLKKVKSELTAESGDYMKVKKAYEDSVAGGKGGKCEVKLADGSIQIIEDKKSFGEFTEKMWAGYENAIKTKVNFHDVAFRDYGEKTGDRMDGIMGATMAGEQVKIMQDTIWKTDRTTHQLFRDPAFVEMLEKCRWQELASQFNKASKGEESMFDPKLVAGVTKKGELADIGNMFKNMMGDAEGEMRGSGLAVANNVIAKTFRMAFVDQINDALKVTAGQLDGMQIQVQNARNDLQNTLANMANKGTEWQKNIFKGLPDVMKINESFGTDAKDLEKMQTEMLNRLKDTKNISDVARQEMETRINRMFAYEMEDRHKRRETNEINWRIRQLSELDFVARNMVDRKDDKLQ